MPLLPAFDIMFPGISPDSYVIFICGYDPFGKGKYRYNFRSKCLEIPEMELEEGRYTIILNNRGCNPGEVPKELVSFLKYTKANLEESTGDFGDHYVRKVQKSIERIKGSREMEGQYMTLQELLKEERDAGILEGHAAGVKEGHAAGVKEGHAAGVKEGHAAGVKEGHAAGFKEGIALLVNLINEGKLTIQDAAKQVGLTKEDFQHKYMNNTL